MFAAAHGLELLKEMLHTTQVIHTGISATIRQESLAKLFLKEAKKRTPTWDLANSIATKDANETERARKIAGADYDAINSLVVVAMCTVYEVALEDTLKAHLRFEPGIISRLRAQGLDMGKLPDSRDLTYKEARSALKKLRDWSRNRAKVVPDGDIFMFSAVGISINPDQTTRSAIRELIYLRNLIVHKAKRADEKCMTEAPRLKLRDGELFIIGRADMGLYVSSLLSLLSEIAQRLAKINLDSALKAQTT